MASKNLSAFNADQIRVLIVDDEPLILKLVEIDAEDI